MAASRSTWKGFLKLSLVSCPIRMMPAATRSNRVSFHNLNPETNNRIEMRPHDSVTGEELDDDDLVKGYEFERGQFVTVEEEELEALELESSHTIDLERFVPADAVDTVWLETPYFLAPDGPVAEETFRVIRAALEKQKRIGIGRVVLGRREQFVTVGPRGRGLMMMTLRSADEVRAQDEYFADLRDTHLDKAKVELAGEIVDRMSGRFDPAHFEDRFETALHQLVDAKLKGTKIVEPKVVQPAPVIDLMAALKRSLQQELKPRPAATDKKPRRAAAKDAAKPAKAERPRKRA